MVIKKRLSIVIVVFLILIAAPINVSADITFSAPTAANENLASCDDYFHDEWGMRLSMDDAASGVLNDIPEAQLRFINNPSYTNGIFSFTTGSNSPEVFFVHYTTVGSLAIGTRYGEQKPINTAYYKNLTFRMYSSKATIGRVRWFHAHDRWALGNFNVFKGWHTYQIDLSTLPTTLTVGSSTAWTDANAQGLELFPSNESGVDMALDWVMLNPVSTACPKYTVSYNATASNMNNLYAIFADTNSDFTDGIVEELTLETVAGADTVDLSSAKLFPGSYNIYGVLSGDWATLKLFNPFDMADEEDVRSDLVNEITSTSFFNGFYRGTTTGTDPHFYLNLRNGETIDASVYSFFSIGITVDIPTATDNFRLLFFNADSTQLLGFKDVTVNDGANVLQFQVTAGDGWSGQIGAIRLDPVQTSGVQFLLDFVAIRQAGYVNTLGAPTVEAATGTVKLNNFQYSMVQPDKAGGRDFAQTSMNNSWNMNAAGDVTPIYNVAAAYIYPHNSLTDAAGIAHVGDFLYAINAPNNGDANYFSIKDNAQVDTSQFVNVCFRGWNQTEALAPFNSVARILWQDPREGNVDSSYKAGDDIVMTRGNTTYCVDMRREIQLEPPLPAGAPNPWTSIGDAGQRVSYFRVDMNENDEGAASQYYSVLDFITLRTDHEANSQYAFVVDAPLNLQVDIFINSARSTSGGTYIGSLNAGRNTNVFKWDSSGTAEGFYYSYGRATSGGNTLYRLSEGRIKVNHSLTQDTTAPILECERPSSGYLFDTSIELAGYALDETRLATVEVFVDNTYFTSISPNKFHLGARDAYTLLAESNNPGFQQMEDATTISYGAHTVKFVATDTAGNETTCEKAVTRQNGASTSPLTYPDPNAERITLPLDATTSSPTLTASITSKKNVSFSIGGTAACSVVSLQGARTNAFNSPVEIYRASGVSTVNLNSLNIPKFKPPTGKSKSGVSGKAKKPAAKDEGKLFFKVICGPANEESPVRTINAKSLKNPKTSPKEDKILKLIKSKAAVQ